MIRKKYGKIKNEKKARDYRRKLSIRKKVSGTAERPRICAVRTNKHLSVQIIDDVAGTTIACIQTFGKTKAAENSNAKSAQLVGKAVGEKLSALNIKSAVYDRNGKQYTGVVLEIAKGIRESGIQI
jgi:large subunit ribosomal protein L18